jgi:hypothetical protein
MPPTAAAAAATVAVTQVNPAAIAAPVQTAWKTAGWIYMQRMRQVVEVLQMQLLLVALDVRGVLNVLSMAGCQV